MDERGCGKTSEGGPDRRTAVVIDGERIWRDAAARVLIHMGIDVVARASSMRAGLLALRQSRPDIVVVELSGSADDLHARDFLRGTRTIGIRRVIAFSRVDDRAAARLALASGAIAYVVKSAELSDLDFAVRQVLHRSIYLSSDEVSDEAELQSEGPSADLLTKRELEIVWLVAEGYSNSEIAKQLWVTQQTVKFHLSNIFRKLDVSGRAAVAEWARHHGVATLRAREVSR